ncbi:MAG: hypothetical protein GX442_13880 [Candidatus Riflebacteria bacterium]|nr:hypothetical protein [Candidatus Riflebacteria bacterium]
MFFVLGIVAVMVPLLLLFSMIGSSQAKQAMHFHDRITTEAIAWSALEAGIARLQASGGADLVSGSLSEVDYQFSLNPTGTGMASQALFNVFARSQKGPFTYIYLTVCEQIPRSPLAPADPNPVITHDFWGTVQNYDITQAFDCVAIANARGADYLEWERTVTYEQDRTDAEYRAALLGKASGLPPEVAANWSAIVDELARQKAVLTP